MGQLIESSWTVNFQFSLCRHATIANNCKILPKKILTCNCIHAIAFLFLFVESMQYSYYQLPARERIKKIDIDRHFSLFLLLSNKKYRKIPEDSNKSHKINEMK